MATPSEKYAVDYTDNLGLKWSKPIATMYPSLGNVDLSATMSSFNDPLVKTVYHKSRTFNPIYDNAITYASVGHDSLVAKYFARNGYPTDDVTSGTVIVNHASPDGLSYATGVNADASVPYNGGLSDSRVLVDTAYNKMLFKVTLREMTLDTSDTPIPDALYNDPAYTDVELKDIDDDKWYGLFYHNGAKVWDGSDWVDTSIAPVMICSGDTVQSFQGGGSAFNNLFNNYNGTMGSGQNIEFTNVASNYYWTAHNFVNNMNIENYSMGWSDSYDYKPSFADNFDAMKAFMLGYLTDNNYSPWQSAWFQLCREVHQISNDMSILLSVHCYACLDGNHNLYINWDNTYTFPIIKGSSVSKFLAGYGLYYLTDSSADLTDITPDNLGDSDDIWVGEMASDGTTTGNWIKGSDIDRYNGYNKDGNINNPVFDPSGGGGGATDEDDPWHGVKYGTGGYGSSPFCTSYAMTGAELTQLAAWGGKPESEGGPKAGYDYMPSIISLVEMPMTISGTIPSTVKFSRGTLGGYESNIVDTGVSGNPITAATQRYNLGSVTLPLRMNSRGYPFLDWDTVVELYMPFVGMFSLDPFAVLGRTITAFMDLDVLNGTICGYAYVTNNGEILPVAYGSAQVGVSLPVTSDGAATARLALTTANAQLGSSFASSTLQLGTLAAAGGTSAIQGSNAWTAMQSARGAGLAAQTGRNIFAGGASDAVSGYATSSAIGSIANSFVNWGLSLKQLQSSNNTQVNGAMGGGSFSGWSTPNQAYVKIIRPHAASGAKSSEYGNTHAYPYEDNAKLKDCKGLTFAVNPNVSGITKATDAERSQIAEILMGGVIA